jgi:hypothetical protein
MKAKLVDSVPTGDWIYEIKFDGYRSIALHGGNETRLLSRNQKDLGSKFPEVKDSIAALDVQDAIIDYAASGIINAMPYHVLCRTEHGVPLARYSPVRHKKGALVRVP